MKPGFSSQSYFWVSLHLPRTSYVLDTDKRPRVTVMLIEDSEAGYAVRLFVRHQAPTASNPIFKFEALIKLHDLFLERYR